MKILGIDDNEDINKLFQVALNSMGHEFSYSLTGREGLELIRKNKYDVVLLDLAMPEFSGIELLSSLEHEGLIDKQKIIIVTASSVVDRELSEFRQKGISDCLKKPVDLDALLTRIEAVAA